MRPDRFSNFRSFCASRRPFFAPLLLAALFTPIAAQTEPLVVFVVRHAEKIACSGDTELTKKGKERAEKLAAMLASSGITERNIYSTKWKRTRMTARPLLKMRCMEKPKEARQACLAGTPPYASVRNLVNRLKEEGGQYLVVGHSGSFNFRNSSSFQEIVLQLGGVPCIECSGGKGVDENEFNRLYVVTNDTNVTEKSIMKRFDGHDVEFLSLIPRRDMTTLLLKYGGHDPTYKCTKGN